MNKLSKSGGVDMKALEQERSRVRDKLNQSNNRKKAAPAAQKAKVYALLFQTGGFRPCSQP